MCDCPRAGCVLPTDRAHPAYCALWWFVMLRLTRIDHPCSGTRPRLVHHNTTKASYTLVAHGWLRNSNTLPDSETTAPFSWGRVQCTVSCGIDLKLRDVMRPRMTSGLSRRQTDAFQRSDEYRSEYRFNIVHYLSCKCILPRGVGFERWFSHWLMIIGIFSNNSTFIIITKVTS
jgi:hypothetical protein